MSQPAAEHPSSALVKPRVLIITTVPVSFIFFRSHIRYLKQQNFEVGAVSSPGPELDDVGRSEEIPSFSIPMTREITPLKDCASLWKLKKLFENHRPDIVHAFTPKAALLTAIAARLAGVPIVVLSVFGLVQMTRTGLQKAVLDATTRLSCKLASMIWCDGRSLQKFLLEHNLSAGKEPVVLCQGSANGVDARTRFNPDNFDSQTREKIRAQYGIPRDAIVIGFVGRIVRDKGIPELVSAWRTIREKFPEAHLLLVGPEESRDPISADDKALLSADGRIHCAGKRSDVPEHLLAMDVFVLPSHREGFGSVCLEAAAMRLPVVATQAFCRDAIEEGKTGMTVPIGDAPALERALSLYLHDPSLRAAHGIQGRERALRDFDPDAISVELHRAYVRLLEQKGVPQMRHSADAHS